MWWKLVTKWSKKFRLLGSLAVGCIPIIARDHRSWFGCKCESIKGYLNRSHSSQTNKMADLSASAEQTVQVSYSRD
jgi:hypothetical protein